MVTVYGADGDALATLSETALPAVFSSPIRPDLVRFVHTNMAKNHRQPYAVNANAGHQTSALSWGTGRAVSRIPRNDPPSTTLNTPIIQRYLNLSTRAIAPLGRGWVLKQRAHASFTSTHTQPNATWKHARARTRARARAHTHTHTSSSRVSHSQV